MMMMMMLIERRPLSFVGDLRYRFHSILTTHLPWRLISECKVSRTLHDASCKAFDLGRFLWPAQKVSCWLLHKTNMSLSILCFVYQHLVGATQSWISRWHRAKYDVNPNLNRFQPEGRKNPWTAQPMGSLNILYFSYAVEVCWSFIKPEHTQLVWFPKSSQKACARKTSRCCSAFPQYDLTIHPTVSHHEKLWVSWKKHPGNEVMWSLSIYPRCY